MCLVKRVRRVRVTDEKKGWTLGGEEIQLIAQEMTMRQKKRTVDKESLPKGTTKMKVAVPAVGVRVLEGDAENRKRDLKV